MSPKVIGCLIGALAAPALACDFPDEGGMPLRRAVTKVQMLSEVDAWSGAMRRNGVTVQYLVRLDEPLRKAGRCYWPVEVRADGKMWKQFLVSPDGKSVLSNTE
jgi:hypothetical protein